MAQVISYVVYGTVDASLRTTGIRNCKKDKLPNLDNAVSTIGSCVLELTLLAARTCVNAVYTHATTFLLCMIVVWGVPIDWSITNCSP